jgi:D-alanyl-D-alanine carboxypeptidase/D-alanyl-D-alanine-endopeptidase (penicillin-binding protein 4)
VPLTKNWQVTAVSAGVGLVVALVAVAASGPWESGQRTAERAIAASRDLSSQASGRHRAAKVPEAATAPLASDVLTAATSSSGVPLPTRAGLAGTLAPLLDADGLGPVRTAVVLDAATGRTVYGYGAAKAGTPASTTKIATAVAALSLLGPDHTFTTSVVADRNADRITLVGGGDPTLTARAEAGGGYDAASLRKLADDTARGLLTKGETKVRLTYDTSLYSGPSVHPIGHNDNLAPVTALMADEGRADGSTYKGPASRSWDPAQSAANSFAALLEDRGIKVTGTPSAGKASGGELAEVQSVPLSDLVERMLTNSDNDIAEALARQAAIASGRPASFAGGAQAIAAALKHLGVDLTGARFTDGSGLNHSDALSAQQLAGLLVLAGSSHHPELRSVLTGLPVAAFSGSLTNRFSSGVRRVGAGFVRAKTGTLTGVNALAGTVVDADGRLLTFAFLTSGTTDPTAAVSSLDRLAAAVANCGCR